MASYLMYPWFVPLQQHMARAFAERQPASMLLASQRGLGVDELALWLAHALLCQDGQDFAPCGQCAACKLWQAGNHTDFLLLQPAEGKKQIGIDQVRELLPFAMTSPMVGQRRVIFIAQAQLMNQAAANALLKVLEEPPAKAVFILSSERPGALLPTIRSRTVRLDLRPALPEQGLPWLQQQLPAVSADQLQSLWSQSMARPLLALALAEEAAKQQSLQQVALAWMGQQQSLDQWLAAYKDWTMDEVLSCWLQWLSAWLARDLGLVADKLPWPPVEPQMLMQLYDSLLLDQQGLQQGQNWQQQAWLIDFAWRLRRLPRSVN